MSEKEHSREVDGVSECLRVRSAGPWKHAPFGSSAASVLLRHVSMSWQMRNVGARRRERSVRGRRARTETTRRVRRFVRQQKWRVFSHAMLLPATCCTVQFWRACVVCSNVHFRNDLESVYFPTSQTRYAPTNRWPQQFCLHVVARVEAF